MPIIFRDTIEGSDDWDLMALRSTDHFNQLSFGPTIDWHNCRFALGASAVLSTGVAEERPIIMDRRCTFDIYNLPDEIDPVLLKGKFEQGKMELEAPYVPQDHYFHARASICHTSFKGRLLFLNVRGELRWVDEMHGLDRVLYTFPDPFGPLEDNSKNALHPVSGHMFEHAGYIWAIVATAAKTRSETGRQPSRLLRFELQQYDYTNGAAPVFKAVESTVLKDLDNYSINASGMNVLYEARGANLIDVLYEDPEFQQVRHLAIDLTSPNKPVQTFIGYVHNVWRSASELRSALTKGNATGHQAFEPFVIVNDVTINKAEMTAHITFTAYSRDGAPLQIDAKQALSWVDKQYPLRTTSFTTAIPQPSLQSIESSPEGVQHTFSVHLLDPGFADELAHLQDRLSQLEQLKQKLS